MQQKTSASIKNRILSRLSAGDMALLKPDLEQVELPLRHVLEVPNKPIKHSLFHRVWARFRCRQEWP